MSERALSLVEIHFAVLLFGAAGVFGKLLELNAAHIVLGRTFFASAALALLLLFLDSRQLYTAPKRIAVLFLLGAVLALHWWSFFRSIQLSTVAIGLLTFASFPVFTTVLEPLIFKTPLRAIDALSACLVAAGLIIVVPEYNFANSSTIGVLWGILSGFTFAILQVLNRRWVMGITALQLSFGQNLSAFLILLPLAPSGAAIALGTREWLLLIVLGVVCTALAHTMFIRGLRHVRAQLASLIAGLEPVYGIAIGILILGEVPRSKTLVGGGLILGTVIAASRRPAPEPVRERP